MKKQRRIKWVARAMALLLAGTAVLGGVSVSPMTAQAAPSSIVEPVPTATGTITIHKKGSTPQETLTGAAFSVYRVIDLTPGTTAGDWAEFKVSDKFSGMTGMPTKDELGYYSTAELEALITSLSAYIQTNSIAADASLSEAEGGSDTADGTFTFNNLALGYYLVVETEAPAGHVAGKPFLISVPSTSEGGTEWEYSVTAEPKNPTVTIEKTQAAGDAAATSTADDGTVKVDDYIKYEINTTIPNYTEEYFTEGSEVYFTITDVMSDGLAIQADNTTYPITVSVKDNDGTGYATVEKGAATYTLTAQALTGAANADKPDLTVAFVKDYIKAHRGADVKVTYYAKVTADAVSGSAGNPNKAGLQYNSKPGEKADATPSIVTVYTFDIDVIKFADKNGTDTGLDGAEFELYSDAACTAANKIGDTKTTAGGGRLSFTKLDEGTYYLKETKAPTGYTLLANPIQVEIAAVKDTNGRPTGAITLKIDGTEISAATGTYVTHVDSGKAVVAVENYPGFNLPQTGGAGIALFLLIGAAGIIAVSIAMTRKTKKAR